jgi:hypothetical protein
MILLSAFLLASVSVPAAAFDQFRQAEAIRSTQPIKARGLYERAARYGHPGAQATYGMLLFTAGNRIGALRWLKAAAEQGEPRGMLLWGTALFNGDGVAVDRPLGYSMVARAAKAGLAEAEGTRSEMDLVMSPAERNAAARLLAPVAETVATSIKKTGKPTKVPASLSRSKKRPAVTKAFVSAPAAGSWRIQLGAFRHDGSAEALFAQLSARLPGKQASYLPLGSMTRLLAGPYDSKLSAQAACRALGPRQACFPVAPR